MRNQRGLVPYPHRRCSSFLRRPLRFTPSTVVMGSDDKNDQIYLLGCKVTPGRGGTQRHTIWPCYSRWARTALRALHHRSSLLSDVFAMHVRAQNAAVVVRILVNHVRFEIFEVSPRAESVVNTVGKLLCSYPGPAIQISSDIFSNECFLGELASFLMQMDVDVTGSTDLYENVHPRYISELLVGILRGFGQPASVDRITKRIGDEVLSEARNATNNTTTPWRRSPLWLVIRVVLQTSLDFDMYKKFILLFHAHLV